MTWNNPHPLANPYNTRFYGNFNINKQMNSGFYINRNCDLHVPQAKPYIPQDDNLNTQYDNLHVPNQLPLNSPAVLNTFQTSRFVTLPDGTVIDMVARKVVKDPNTTPGCWGSGKLSRPKETESMWTDEDIYGQKQLFGSVQDTGLSKNDIEYNRMKQEQDKKLVSNMSDEQKRMLANLDSILGKSKLIEESKKYHGRN